MDFTNKSDGGVTYAVVDGVRVVCAPLATDVVYCGIAVDGGSRDELENEHGLAHFCEHMSFKGTLHRRAFHILNRMESVGGELNAYTGKEETVFYSVCMRQHVERALDLLADIVLCSTYPEAELRKEVEVVIDEIESYNDAPAELIFDDFDRLVFSDHSLGRNILGDAERLRRYGSNDLRGFVDRLYRRDNLAVFVLGKVEPDRLFAMVERCLRRAGGKIGNAGLRGVEARRAVPEYVPKQKTIERGTHQAHVLMGGRAFGRNDVRRPALALLSNILGGPGMNSRLNISLREKRGLVYTVESSVMSFTDSGAWGVYFGCDHADVGRCRRLVLAQLQRLVDSPLSERALSAAKRQIKGQTGVAYDNLESVALSMGKQFLHDGRVRTLEEQLSRFDALSARDLQEAAALLFVPERLTTVVYR